MRCAVYVRVSTEMEIQTSSIAHQISYFERYIKEKGWTLVELYQDRESGTTIVHREGLKKLISDSQEGKFDLVLTKSISRFARNTLEGLQLARDLKEKNIRLITIEDGFDSVEYDEFMFTLLLSIAQKESEKMSQRIQFGKLCRAKNGGYNGSTPPYGYQNYGKILVPSNNISKYVVEKIFTMYLEGNGIYTIAKELNRGGYPTPSMASGRNNSSSTWHQSTIRKILSNRFYVGDMLQNKTRTLDVLTGKRRNNQKDEYVYVENTHEGIISRQVFDEVQIRLNKKREKNHSRQTHLFANILRCGRCGSGMHFKKAKESYICGKTNKMGKEACTGAYIKEDDLKKILLSKMVKMIDASKRKDIRKSTLKKLENNFAGAKLKELETQVKKAKNKKQKILDLFVENIIDKENFQRKIKELDSELAIIGEQRLKLINQQNNGQEEKEFKIDKILGLKDIDYLFLSKLIRKIQVFENKVEVSFNFKE